tara:strand:- start:2832 stop:3422 length:591 start_codon:yes stop_codon:yes gene_type:complete
MERPYIDKWQQYLLREGTEKAPYFKNIYGGINKVTFANVKSVEKTMSRILKTPVTIEIPGQAVYTELMADGGNLEYYEYVNDSDFGGTGWQIWKSFGRDGYNYYTWGVQNSIPYAMVGIKTHDASWDYIKHTEAGKVSYLIAHGQRNIAANKNLRPFKTKLTGRGLDNLARYASDYMELIPGTKAYDAVKQKIFKD